MTASSFALTSPRMKEIFNCKEILTRLYRMHKIYSWRNRAEHLMFLIKYYIVILSSLVPSSTSKTSLVSRVIFDFACTKISETFQFYKTYSIFHHHLLKTCFKRDVYVRKCLYTVIIYRIGI